MGDGEILLNFLRSEECSSFMETMEQSQQELSQFDDETITSFLCNPIEISKLTIAGQQMKEAVTDHTDDDILPCEIAYAKYMTEYTDSSMILEQSKSTPEACEEEVTNELIILRNRRALREEGGHRELLDIIAIMNEILLFFLLWYCGFVPHYCTPYTTPLTIAIPQVTEPNTVSSLALPWYIYTYNKS